MRSRSHGLATLASVIGAVSFVVAPQLPYLADRSRFVSGSMAVGLSLIVGLGLAFAGRRWLVAGLPRWAWLAAPAPVVLWLPAAMGHPVLAPAARACAALILVAVAVALHRTAVTAVPQPRSGFLLVLLTIAVAVTAEMGRWLFFSDRLLLPWALVWTLLVLAALVGWGRLVGRVVWPHGCLDWGLAGALGLAFACAAGGTANLTWTVSPRLLVLFLALGSAAWFLDRPARVTADRRRGSWIVVAVAALALALQLTGAAAGTVDTVNHRPALDQHDDAQAYMVFTDNLLAIGSLGPEPFEARRMLSLGAQSLLQTLILAANPVPAVHLLDAGIGLVLLLGLVAGASRSSGGGWPEMALVAAVVLTLPHLAMRGNTSACLVGTVLLVALFRLVDERSDADAPATAGLALVAAALVAVKTTFAPAAVVFLLAVLVPPMTRRGARGPALRSLIGVAATAFLLLLPWMVSVYESSGTLLYPVLGRGFYGGVTDTFAWAEGSFVVPLGVRLMAVVERLVDLVPALLLLSLLPAGRSRRGAEALMAAGVASMVALAFLGNPSLDRSLLRYAFPVVTAGILGLLLAALRPTPGHSIRLRAVAAVAVVFLMVAGRPEAVQDLYTQLVRQTVAASRGPAAASADEVAASRQMAAAIPPGAPVVATLAKPFLFDPRDHRWYIMSLPGMASPPPGLPLDRGPEALAQAFRAHGIRFLAYGGRRDLGDLLQLTERNIRERYPDAKDRWIMLRGHQRYRELVDALADSRKRVYDDGRRIALDLATRVATVAPDSEWTGGDVRLVVPAPPPRASYVVLRSRQHHPVWASPALDGLEVTVDGRPLALDSRSEGAAVFRLGTEAVVPFELVIRSPLVPSTILGGRQDGPPLGVDLELVEVATDRAAAREPVATLVQSASGALDPARVWRRSGFYDDFNWTDGDAVLEGLGWRLPTGADRMQVELSPVHPDGDDPEALGLQLIADGLDLQPLVVEPGRFVFRLPPDWRTIESLRIRSATFVPRERTGAPDDRRLGVPVLRITPLVGEVDPSSR